MSLDAGVYSMTNYIWKEGCPCHKIHSLHGNYPESGQLVSPLLV